MSIYLRILAAHFVGDYILQTNFVYSLKVKYFRGLLFHVLLVVSMIILFLWPYLNNSQIWLLILFIGVTHLIQDYVKLKFLNKFKNNLLSYLLDQVLHVAAISVVFLTSLQYLRLPSAEGNPIVSIYNNDGIMIYLMALIIASYNGFFMILLFRKDYLQGTYSYTNFEKWYGIAERAFIVALIFIHPKYLVLLPIVVISRLIMARLSNEKFKVGDKFVSTFEIASSLGIAILVGLGLLQLA